MRPYELKKWRPLNLLDWWPIEDEPCHKPQIDPQIHIMKVGEDSSEKRLAWVNAKTKSLADCF